MDRGIEPLEAVETALQELDTAERAGVFHRTHVDPDAMWQPAPSVRRLGPRRWYLRGGAIAAVLAVAVSTWAWMFASQIRTLRDQAALASKVRPATGAMAIGSILDCLGGPHQPASAECVVYDFDADRDVDLLDYRSAELSGRSITR
jgi:hypothetical protein